MKTPDALFGYKKQSPELRASTTLPIFPGHTSDSSAGSTGSFNHSPNAASISTPAHIAPSIPVTEAARFPATPSPGGPSILQTASGPYDPDSVLTKLHPAIRAQYAAMLQRKQATGQQHTPQLPPDSSNLRHNPQATPSTVPSIAQTPSGQQQSLLTTNTGGGAISPRHVEENHSQTYVPQPQSQSQNSYPMVQQMQQAPAGNPQVHSGGSNCALTVTPISRAPTGQNGQQGPGPAARPEPSTPTTQPRPTAPKQTPVPPPRPWEQLQRSVPNNTMPPPPSMQPLGSISNTGPGSSQPGSDQGPLPSNVSGPFWQTHSQTMPNSNSLSPQPSFDPFQFINFQ